MTTGMTTRRTLTAAVAAGGLLLTACGTNGATSTPSTPSSTTSLPASSTSAATATGTSSQPPAPSDPDTSSSTQDSALAPVDCGEVSLGTGAVHRLIAAPAANGLVGCTEAFTVVDEFVSLPPEKRSEASLGNVLLAGGWSCTVDDGETANLGCVKGEVGDQPGFALHTEQQPG